MTLRSFLKQVSAAKPTWLSSSRSLSLSSGKTIISCVLRAVRQASGAVRRESNFLKVVQKTRRFGRCGNAHLFAQFWRTIAAGLVRVLRGAERRVFGTAGTRLCRDIAGARCTLAEPLPDNSTEALNPQRTADIPQNSFGTAHLSPVANNTASIGCRTRLSSEKTI